MCAGSHAVSHVESLLDQSSSEVNALSHDT